MSMARPAARAIASSTVAVTLLLLSLMLVLLPAPASSQAAAVVGVIGRSPVMRQFGKFLIRKVATEAGPRLIEHALASGSNNDQLGAAAADNAGVIIYNISIGPARQSFSGVVDIFEGFLWVQCPPAPAFSRVPCASPTCLSALNITADDCPNKTSDCSYVYVYGSGTNTTGYLANETFNVGVGGATAQPITGSVVFGCSTMSTVPLDDDEPGAIGFSQGRLSLLSQLDITRFSYFLTPDDSNSSDSTSVVLLGDQAVPQTRRSRSTPLFRSNVRPDLYYVKLTGIQVDGESLTSIPAGAFDLAADGNSGGVVLSTTVPVTYLQEDAYKAVRQELVRKIKSQPVNSLALDDGVFDLCYNMLSVAKLTFPKITLVFDGRDSPAIELTTVNYFYKDNDTGLQCLTMLPTPADSSVGSILGSMLQAGTNMIYDVGAGRLTFEKGAAAPVLWQVSPMVISSLLLIWVLLF